MALAFKNLCADFCELAGLPPSEPDGEAGGASLAIEFDEVPLTIAQTEASAQDLVLVARLGTPQPDAELPVSRMVLEANYYLLGHDAPVFSRHPESGEILLQYVLALADCTPASLYGVAAQAAQLARRWRSGAFEEGLAASAERVNLNQFA